MPIGFGWVDAGAISFINQNFDATIVRQVHQDADVLAQLLYARVEERTPVRTGALASSIEYEANTDDISNNDLVVFTVNDAPQIEQWGRVYWMYQEGPPIGLPTYTNPPHHMFYGIETDDLDIINAWIKGSVDTGLDILARGKGEQR